MIKNIRGSLKHVFAVFMLCLTMSISLVCLADEKGTVTVESAKIREKADTSSNQLGSVAQGKTVDIISETTGSDGKTWYQVYVDANTKGYIRADLVKKSGASSTSNTTSQNTQSATVTDVEVKTGTVVTNSVRVRKSASTDSTEIATVSKGIVVTVTGETTGTDGKKWYKVSFKYSDKNIEGFIRADLVTFENVPADTAVSEITGEENVDGQTETEAPAEQETQAASDKESTASKDENSGIILMNVEEEPYIMPGFELVSLDWNNQKINAYRNGKFFIFYAQKQNGEEGWYMLDREEGVYQRYPYTAEGATIPKTSAVTGNILPIIVLVVIIVILVFIIVLMLVKMRGSSDGYEIYGDDDGDDNYADDDYADEEELEDIEELEEEPAPVRRPAPAPMRRPAPQSAPASQHTAGTQPAPQSVRRPMPQSAPASQRPTGTQPAPQSAPVRRPAPQSAPASQRSAGAPQQQPVRRPAPQSAPVRRPTPQGTPGQSSPAGQTPRRPMPQNNRPVQNVQPPKGQRAKNFLENDDDDMDFIDI